LAARVQQLETMIRMQTQMQQQQYNGNAGNVNFQRQNSDQRQSDDDDDDDDDVKSEQSAVEVAAADALGQLSKSTPGEGGSEARICKSRLHHALPCFALIYESLNLTDSGPGSLADFITASGLGADNGAELGHGPRARVEDMKMCSSIPTLLSAPALPHSLTRLADALQEQKAKFPPAPICHYLFDLYYGNPIFADRARMMPRGSIQLCYDALFDARDKDMSPNAQAARALKYPQLASPVSLAFFSLVFATLACALTMSPGATPETHMLAYNMYEASRSAFMASERREQPTYAVINALLSQTLWLKVAGCPSLGFTYVAQAIRFGQSMGLHREPGETWGLGAFECEIRRRMWWGLFCADRGHSICYGRPYIIMEKHCDVKLPANIYEEDLTANGPINVRPSSEITQLTGHFVFIGICKVIVEIIDRAFSCKTPTYATIIELDNLLTKMENETIPPGFRNPSVQDLNEKPYIKADFHMTQIMTCWIRSFLHRPYLLKPLPKPGEADHYAGSRAAVIALSQRQLTLVKDVLSRTPDHNLPYFGFAFNTFEPAVNLAMAIHQDPFNPNTSVIDSYVQQAMALLERMSPFNKCSQEGYQNLKFMRQKYLARIGSPHFSSSSSIASSRSPPATSFSLSSGASPSSAATSNHTPPIQSLSAPLPEQDNAPTPNTLFNQFFKDYASPAGTGDYPNLFDSSDPQATWMEETAPVEDWPSSYTRLEGEQDFSDWSKMLGL
jgi:hypothetical protein